MKSKTKHSEIEGVFPEIKGVTLTPIHKKCIGCQKIIVFDGFEGPYCSVYPNPSIFWRRGGCPIATHIKTTNNEKVSKVRVGQQKQRKNKR